MTLNSSPGWHNHVLLLIQSEGPTTLLVSSIFDNQQHLRKMKNFSTEIFENPGMLINLCHVYVYAERENQWTLNFLPFLIKAR